MNFSLYMPAHISENSLCLQVFMFISAFYISTLSQKLIMRVPADVLLEKKSRLYVYFLNRPRFLSDHNLLTFLIIFSSH
jgi:hypothetical protein